MKKNHGLEWALFACAILLLLVFLLYTKGPYRSADTTAYLNKIPNIPPLYPWYLELMKAVFPNGYLWAAVFVQTVLAAAATVLCARAVWEMFAVEKTGGRIIVWLCLIAVFFGGGHGIVDGFGSWNLAVLTEGMAYALFYFFAAFSIKYCMGLKYKSFIGMCMMCILLASCRNQFVSAFAMAFLFVFCLFIYKKVTVRRTLFSMVLLTASFFCVGLMQSAYDKSVGAPEEDVRYYAPQVTHLSFFAQEEDILNIEDEEAQKLYRTIYRTMRENKWHYDDAGDSWLDKQTAYIKTYEDISTYMYAFLMSYYSEAGATEREAYNQVIAVQEKMEAALAVHYGQWILIVIQQFPIILAMSIFTYSREIAFVSIPYAVIVTLLYIAGNLYLMKKNRRISAVNWFCIFVFIFITGTGLSTSYIVKSLLRYEYYTCGLFYVSGGLMLREVLTSSAVLNGLRNSQKTEV